MQSHSKSQQVILDMDKLIQTFIWKGKRFRVDNTTLKKKNKVGRLISPAFKATIILANYRQMNQWNRRKSPQIDPQKYSQFIVDKREKVIQWSKDRLFNKYAVITGCPHTKKKVFKI